MKSNNLRVCLLIVGVILVAINISQLDFDNLMNERYYGILSNLLLIAAMVVSIRYSLKQKDS